MRACVRVSVHACTRGQVAGGCGYTCVWRGLKQSLCTTLLKKPPPPLFIISTQRFLFCLCLCLFFNGLYSRPEPTKPSVTLVLQFTGFELLRKRMVHDFLQVSSQESCSCVTHLAATRRLTGTSSSCLSSPVTLILQTPINAVMFSLPGRNLKKKTT